MLAAIATLPTATVPKKGDPIAQAWRPLVKQPLPAGRPRSWYIAHNRRLKAMRLAIALLDAGAFTPDQVTDEKIHHTAEVIGIHPPSPTTCRMVRRLMQARR
ncbi:hypothetical protein [Nocardia otitidiscaviarum]|uniref:hypothetical protein n=1 Tax=Nocardia otitidiscaviarum TaxID=1823 RepID=UPI0004A6CA63|nr:hypothetical protein [Nocardia otitidiscaviarum]